MRSALSLLVASVLLASAVAACGADAAGEARGEAEIVTPSDASPPPLASDGGIADASTGLLPFTKAEVQTLFDEACAACHGPSGGGGLVLVGDFEASTLGKPSTAVPAMMRIARGARGESYLFHKIAGTHGSVGGSGKRMPAAGPPLTADEIERVGLYIDGL